MTAVGACSATGCQVANGGSCIEGFEELTECPNFSQVDRDDDEELGEGRVSADEATASSDVEETDAPLALSTGKALTVREGHLLTGECIAQVVALIGMVKSGKTTVLAELYERFCKGPFAGYLFAGSSTIMGFEQICYFSRAVSQREVEDTDRTKRSAENNLLHLDLVKEHTGHRQRLLVSDLSGELFEDAIESRENVHVIPYLRRADHVVVFADAEKLGDISERQHLVNQLSVLLRSCIEESRIRQACRVTVAVSRHDLSPGDVDRAFLDSMERRIRQRADAYFDEPIRFLDLAARPETGPEDAYGLAELLSGWMEKGVISNPRIRESVRFVDKSAREIDRFAYKVTCDDK